MKGPAAGELLEAVTMPSHVNSNSSCRRSWSFWALSNSSMASQHEQHVELLGLARYFHGILKDLVLLRQGVQGLHGLVVKIVNLGVRLGVLLVCGASAPLPIVEGSDAVPTVSSMLPRNLSHSPARRRSLSCHARPHRPPLVLFPSVSFFFPFHRNTFGVVCRIQCFTIVPVVASAFVLA